METMETMETKVNTTNETESAAHQTGMMDINDFDYLIAPIGGGGL